VSTNRSSDDVLSELRQWAENECHDEWEDHDHPHEIARGEILEFINKPENMVFLTDYAFRRRVIDMGHSIAARLREKILENALVETDSVN
jgi:hypothetical protein